MIETDVECPFCGETISLLLDPSVDEQVYIEDCSVCCRPISIHAICAEGELQSLVADRS